MNTRKTGSRYETLAASRLAAEGYEILERNFSCRVGEIDLIAKDGAYLVFVEVKYRKTAASGMPVEAVGAAKQKKISAAAAYYLMSRHYSEDCPIRFDVVGILGDQVQIYKNAFSYQYG